MNTKLVIVIGLFFVAGLIASSSPIIAESDNGAIDLEKAYKLGTLSKRAETFSQPEITPPSMMKEKDSDDKEKEMAMGDKEENKENMNMQESKDGEKCETTYLCDDWSECTEGKQMRTCVIDHECEGEKGELPLTEQECSENQEKDSTQMKEKDHTDEEGEKEHMHENAGNVEMSETEQEESEESNDPLSGLLTSRSTSLIFWALVVIVVFGLLIYWRASSKSKRPDFTKEMEEIKV